jgi:hypothetical protein
MPWYIVVIEKFDVVDMSAKALLDKFERALRDVYAAAENPKEVEIWHGHDVFANHVYCFSPTAAAIAIEKGIFSGFNARACSEKPNLDGFMEITGLTK